jgi:carboxyvinyl-carboxyphosphonate phosphorylmutase
MPRPTANERRRRFRDLFDRPAVARAASIFDPLSARLAEGLGYECGMFAGTIASHAVLAAPDLILITLTELAEQARRITRAAGLPFLVDADHGYGNALNVARSVEELEAAGAAALFVEDTLLPRRYGAAAVETVSGTEFHDKLRAAVGARVDPALMIVARPTALQRGDFETALQRSLLARDAGADAIFLIGATTAAQVSEVHQETGLPVLLQNPLRDVEDEAVHGVRFIVPSHLPFFVALKALHDAYAHLAAGGGPGELLERAASLEFLEGPLATLEYAGLARQFLGLDERAAAALVGATAQHTHRA